MECVCCVCVCVCVDLRTNSDCCSIQHCLTVFGAVVLQASACNTTAPNLQHTSNQEQYDQCGNSTEQSQAPDDGYINVRNMLNT